MSAPMICVPGQRLCREEDKLKAGRGTYTRNSFIYSSLAGPLTTTKNDNGVTLVEVIRNAEENVVPTVDALVSARVTNVNPRFCKCAIIKVGRTALKDSFRGMIRKEDVRATEKDKVEMYKCFRPGDIVIARVISLGDSQSYLLTTAENELGVVIATSEAGASLVPVSWNKMRCPKTLTEEYRKVAKVQPQYIEYSGT
ncbi:exosome complex component CSL4-like [Mercenaria mercenaria]|uniref:exosome complex component CSL4-like n=1 Tax=Mercenaria mercenaria TaxID=6596 RepID=UPI001E1DC95D|nr:exosome complex component CSL4-like [Mercenaria mercenaria]